MRTPPLKPLPQTALALLALAMAAFLAASTCENQDYRELESLSFATKEGSAPLLRTVIHPYSGRNTVDFVIRNDGDGPMRIRLTAATVRPTEDTMDAGMDAGMDDLSVARDIPIFLPPTDLGNEDLRDADSPDVPPDSPDFGFNPADFINNLNADSPNLSQRTILVGPGETRIGRFGEEEGLIGVTLIVQLECLSPACKGKLDFVVLLGRLECRNSDDCASGQLCQESTGRCVADPNAGCQTLPTPSPTRHAPLALLLIPLLLLWLLRRHLPPHSAALSLGAALLLTCLLSGEAQANRAVFAQPTSQLTFSGGIKTWTGALADDTGNGLSLDVTEALHYRYLGFQLSLGTAYFLTQQQPPPLSKGIQTYSLRLGPRIILPLGDFRLFADLEYERLGLISNSLVRITGPDFSFHAVGAGITARWLPVPFLVDIKLGYTQVFGLDAGILGLSISLGRLGRL